MLGVVSSARFRLFVLFIGALATMALTMLLPADADARQKKRSGIPVTGELSDGGTFEGKILNPVIQESPEGNVLQGTLKGKATTADGDKKDIKQDFSTPVTATSGATSAEEVGAAGTTPPAGCSIVNLDLGPIDLDVLGLVVNLSAISLDVTAVPGAGNLLGNLLCGIAGLLDGLGLLNLLATLFTIDFLNDLLDALFG